MGPPARVPALVVSGLPDVGKTRLIERLVSGLPQRRVGWVIQDLSGLRGAAPVNAAWRRLEARLPETDGCLLCALREDLVTECLAAAEEHLDLLVVESPGIVPPHLASTTLTATDATRAALRVQAHVAVVAAASFAEDLDDDRDSCDLGYDLTGHDPCVAELLVAQVERADAVVLAGVADVGHQQLARVEALVGLLNPEAVVLHDVDPELAGSLLAGPPRPSVAAAPTSTRRGAGTATDDDAGVSSVHFRARRPFHPTRLQALLETPLDGVLRGRGVAWLASRPDLALRWDHAGPTLNLAPESLWSPTGEPGQALELVGVGLDAEALRRTLEAALLSDEELSAPAASWQALHGPFPDWGAEVVADLPVRESMREPA